LLKLVSANTPQIRLRPAAALRGRCAAARSQRSTQGKHCRLPARVGSERTGNLVRSRTHVRTTWWRCRQDESRTGAGEGPLLAGRARQHRPVRQRPVAMSVGCFADGSAFRLRAGDVAMLVNIRAVAELADAGLENSFPTNPIRMRASTAAGSRSVGRRGFGSARASDVARAPSAVTVDYRAARAMPRAVAGAHRRRRRGARG
jgi:hypothetical protein